MRGILWIRCILCFFWIISYSYSSQSTKVPAATEANVIESWHIFPLDKKKIFFAFAPIYGSLSDGGANATGFAEVAQTNGITKNYIPKVGINWGYQASLGYALSPDYRYALLATFFSLDGARTTSINMNNGSTLFNELTQLGTIGSEGNLGFSTFQGNATADSTAGIIYQRLDFKLQEPWSVKDNPADIFHFYKIKGLMLARINKVLSGYYTGDIVTTGGVNPGTDSMLYGSNSLGIGPEIGLLAYAHVSDRLKIRIEGDSAFLIGYFNSHYREYGTSEFNVDVGDIAGTSFSNIENHPSASWTPIFFDAQATLVATLWKSNKYLSVLTGEGGIGVEYILPTFTGDVIKQTLGNPLVKFNNNLSVSYIIMRLALTGDL